MHALNDLIVSNIAEAREQTNDAAASGNVRVSIGPQSGLVTIRHHHDDQASRPTSRCAVFRAPLIEYRRAMERERDRAL